MGSINKCTLIALLFLSCGSVCAQSTDTEMQAAIEQKRTSAEHKKSVAIRSYGKFCEHFANSEYGTSLIAYKRLWLAIRASFDERYELHRMCKLHRHQFPKDPPADTKGSTP